MPQVAHSSELMTNYLQARIMRPETGIQAVQTEDGRALLLSIGTDDQLYATIEQPGSRTGWQRQNLTKPFAGNPAAKCTGFAVAQVTKCTAGQAAAKAIHMAMIMRDGDNDNLYLSLNNSAADTGWTANPNWVLCLYDDRGHPRPVLRIADVYISEATDDTYIVVDVIRDPSSDRKLRFRYYIDLSKPEGSAWQAHDVPVDVEEKGYQAALGRRWSKGRFQVDGIYTAGHVAGASQLVYAPLYNVFDPETAPNPTILHLPGNAAPDAIATCRNADNTSDLYVAAGGALYYFASTNQDPDAVCVTIAQNSLFNGMRNLFAFLCDAQTVMVWGLNGSNQIFYTTCKLAELGQQDKWSPVLPILSGVEQVTPFVNRAYNATCFFANTGDNTLVKAVKSPGNLLWSFSDITLPPPDTKTKARAFDSYTTRVLVKDDNGLPLGHTKVKLSTCGALTTVYINHIYYIVGPHPIEVETDATGTLTLVEATQTLSATRFNIDAGGGTAVVDPMEKPLRKLSALSSTDKLKDATIRYQDGSTKKFVAGTLDDSDLRAIANANEKMGQVYDSLADQPAPMAMIAAATAGVDRPMVVAESTGSIISDIGDFFAWLGDRIRRGFEAAIEFIKDVASNVWNAIVKVAGEIYRVVIKVVEDVVEFATWVYNKIKVAVEDVIKYLSFVFDIPDMRRTKEVFKHTVKLYLNHQVAGIDTLKHKFDTMIDEAQEQVRTWAGLPPPLGGLGADAGNTLGQSSSYKHSDDTAGSFLLHHYQGNAAGAAFESEPAGHEPSLLDTLIKAAQSELAAMTTVADRIKALAKDLPRLSGLDILKKLLGIVAEFGLSSVKTIVDALLDVLKIVISGIVKALDTPFYIPVVTDILEAFGVPRFSILDLLCWVAAVPTTIIYKLVTSKTPFPDDDRTTFLLSAKTFDELVEWLQPGPEKPIHSLSSAAVNDGQPPAPGPDWLNDYRHMIHVIGQYASGLFTGLLGTIADAAEVVLPAMANPFGKHSAAIAIFAGCSNGIATGLAPYQPLNDSLFVNINRATTGLRIFVKLAFGGWAFATEKAGIDPEGDKTFLNQLRIAGSVIDCILILPSLAATIKHFTELSDKPAGGTRSIAIVNEVGNLTGYIGRLSYLGATVTEGIPKVVFVGVMSVASVCTGGLLIADAFIEPG